MSTRALLVEDDEHDAHVERLTLSQAGFEVFVARSVIEGELHCRTMLDPQQGYVPTAVIIDLRMPNRSHPDLEGTVLAAALSRRMQSEIMWPAYIVGLTNYFSIEREEAALYAGCQRVLLKPLTHAHAASLWQYVQQPLLPPVLSDDLGKRLYQKQAEEILSIVHRGQTPIEWTPDDVALLLGAVSLYPVPETIDHERQPALLLRLGGRQAVVDLLHVCVARMEEPYSRILAAFLSGSDRRVIRETLVEMGYSRTHSYYCINELPARISVWLQQYDELA